MKKFDYYIFIDYSKNLIGYNIIKQEKIDLLIEKISKEYKLSLVIDTLLNLKRMRSKSK